MQYKIKGHLQRDGAFLVVHNDNYQSHSGKRLTPGISSSRNELMRLRLSKNIKLVAFGKAVLGMVRAAQEVLQDDLVSAVVSVPVV